MSTRPVLLVLPLLIACTSDYGVNAEVPDERGADDLADDTGAPAGQEEIPSDVPVAVCEVSPNPVTPPFEAAKWDGTGSYDPNDVPITKYDWTLVEAPTGSAVSMPNGDAVRPGFTPDLAGDYVGQLVVTNADGVSSEPCEITLESIPAEELWVEMYWTRAGDDMDLHLLRGNGQLNSAADCYYANCTGGFGGNLDWGTQGDNSDDPSLDLDDIPGTGPENINILNPESSVTYTVAVHDYPGSVYNGNNDAVVNVYLNGSLVWSDTRTFSGEDDVEYYAEIDWASGTVTGL